MQLRDYQSLPSSPAKARAVGADYYFTGRPCKSGHISARQLSNRTCVECARAAHSKWVAPKRERESARYRKWRAENLEFARETSRKVAKRWAAENPEKHAANCRTRKARKKAADGKHTADDIKRILVAQKERCAWCSASIKSGYHVDHIIPLALGGSNWPSNLQCLCPTCNLRKRAKDPIIFAQEEGRLL